MFVLQYLFCVSISEGFDCSEKGFSLKSVGGVRMYIAFTLKSYRAVKEVGQFKMCVGNIVYDQLMQVCQVSVFLV